MAASLAARRARCAEHGAVRSRVALDRSPRRGGKRRQRRQRLPLIGLVNETGYGVQAASESNWDTDTWDPGIPFNALVPSHSKLPTGADTELFWQSDGGFLRGCSNTGVWVLTVDPNDPSQVVPPAGVSFTLTITSPWSGLPVRSCTSTNPQFYCVASSGAYWLLPRAVPAGCRATTVASGPTRRYLPPPLGGALYRAWRRSTRWPRLERGEIPDRAEQDPSLHAARQSFLLEGRASLAVLLDTHFAFGEAPLEHVHPTFRTAAVEGAVPSGRVSPTRCR